MSEPTVIVGPAIITVNGTVFYSEGNIVETIKRETWQPKLDMYGPFDTRLKTQMVELEFTPVGALANAAALFPYAPANIGADVFAVAGGVVTIQTKAGKLITYTMGAVTKMPTMQLGVNKTWLGSMTVTCKANGAVAYTDAAAWNAVTNNAFSDLSFDDTLVKTGRYLASWGAIFADEGSQDGFEISYEMSTKPLTPDGFNVIAMLLTGLTAKVRFKPISFDEVAFYSHMRLQDSTAIVPGDSVSKMLADMTVTSTTTGLTVVVNKVGPGSGGQQFTLDDYRQGQLEFASRLTFTAGAVNPLVQITIA